MRLVVHGHVDERKRQWLRPFVGAFAACGRCRSICNCAKKTPKPPITVDIMSCLLWVKISRVENNNKAIGAAVAQVMRFPCGNQAGTLRVAIIAV
jgi:hypothetical protein